MRLLFDPRSLFLTHPSGERFPFPLELGDIFCLTAFFTKTPPMDNSEEYADDVRWCGEIYPYPIYDTKKPDRNGNMLIKVQTVFPRKGNYYLDWYVSHENAFLAFAVGDEFDLYFRHSSYDPYTEMKIRMLAYVDNPWEVEGIDDEDEDSYAADILPYGEKVGKLIAQEVDVIEVNYF